MKNTQHKLSIQVPFEYSIHFSRDVFNTANNAIIEAISSKEKNKAHKLLFVVEAELLQFMPNLIDEIENFCLAHKNLIKDMKHTVLIDGGEQLKTFSKIEDICKIIEEHNICRHSFVGIIGGGAFLDAIGFAASIVHRGVRQLRFPTTVLAQCDSGVGVKNGINMFGKKNFLGCFAPPFAVINDLNFLNTLNDRDWRAGISEAVKVAIIKDNSFFDWLCEHAKSLEEREQTSMKYLIEKSAIIHAEHICSNGDPFEFGSARPLDFGHWIAHKLEMMTHNKLRHGEAVAIGIMVDSFYAFKKGWLQNYDFERIEKLFIELGFKLWDEKINSTNSCGKLEIIEGLDEFQEHLGGDLHITLPRGIGSKFEVNELDEEIIIDAIEYLHENHK